MEFPKKSQFLILGSLFFLLLTLFVYSLETKNSYIISDSKYILAENIIIETCKIATLSNGTQLVPRFTQFELDIASYCEGFGNQCNLTITNNVAIPPFGNWSKLNYSHFDFNLNYTFEGLNLEKSFTC